MAKRMKNVRLIDPKRKIELALKYLRSRSINLPELESILSDALDALCNPIVCVKCGKQIAPLCDTCKVEQNQDVIDFEEIQSK